MFRKPLSSKGRIPRGEYAVSLSLYFIYFLITGLIKTLYVEPNYSDQKKSLDDAMYLFGIVVWWFFLAQGAKRCHDRGNNGWYQLIPFYILWMLFADSIEGDNEYGPNPKGIGNVKEQSTVEH
jgi:uncharacterized membrane protein YhaH (DUF805 family)